MTTMVLPLIHNPSKTNSHAFGVNEYPDLCLSELTENSLIISTTHEITKLNNNNMTNLNQAGLYTNGLINMTASPTTTTTTSSWDSTTKEESQNSTAMMEKSPGPIGASATPQTTNVVEDVGILANFPDSWNDWESKRRSESMIQWKKCQNKKQICIRKRIKRKSIEPKKAKACATAASFHHRRRSLDRSIGRHLRSALKTTQASAQSEVVPFQSSKSLRRRQKRRAVRFREEISEEILEWKREQQSQKHHQQQRQKGACSGRGLGSAVGTELLFLEAERERKQSQRALLDLQVGMKCMGL